MTNTDIQKQLREAVRLHRAGEVSTAQDILRAVLQDHPNNADAWYAASLMVNTKARKREMLERALSYDRNHRAARAALDKLNGKTAPNQQSTKAGMSRGDMLLLAGISVVVLAVIVVGIVVILSAGEAEENPIIDLPTLAPTFTPAPTDTVGPTSTPEPTNTIGPTSTNTPLPPFGQTATFQLFEGQTQQANLYALGTVSAASP